MKKLIDWCKKYFFDISVIFLLAFIPLYPKLPLFDVLQTWVYVRLEDVIIAAVLLLFVLFHIRKKSIPHAYLTWPIALYWMVGLVSAVVSILFIGPTLTTFTPHLTTLHFLRRIEYMMLFFVAYGVIAKNRKLLGVVIWTLGLTVLLIALYGAGQKFLGFPAFLTMNEEFAKGLPLRLPPTARIPSTFGGHYDLAAYMVMVIPILGSLAFGVRRWWEKIIFVVLAAMGLVSLLFTASRISFGVYLIAITAMLIWQKKKLFIIPVIIVSFLLLNSVSGASERFYKTFRYSDVIVDLSSGKPIGTLEKLEGTTATVEQQERPDEENLPKGSEFISIASGKTGQAKTIEIISNKPLATGSGEIATVSGSFLIQKALVYDISITTRFQGQWPKAIAAFKRNLLLGSGFGTLSVASDGDYLRMLGETGILGTIAFLGILGISFSLFLRKKETLPPLSRAFVIGLFAGIVGLLFNAVLIDVFEASKVAYSLWLLLGIALALMTHEQLSLRSYTGALRGFFTHKSMAVVYICLFAVFYHIRSLSLYFVGDDFTWLRWAAESRITDIPKFFTEAQGFFWRPIPKLWYFMLYSVFWLKPAMYHLFSLLLLAGISGLVYAVSLSAGIMPFFAFVAGLLFAVLSAHHENVYWISGQSSLLAVLFLFGSLHIWIRLWQKRTGGAALGRAAAVLLLAASMLSYDGMMVAPVILWFIGVFVYRQNGWKLAGLLLFVPVYWLTRIASGAVAPSGDYGYKVTTFAVNALANSVGYLGAFFVGPTVIEFMQGVRAAIAGNQLPVLLAGIIGIPPTILLIKRVSGQPWFRPVLVWLLAGFLALSAYVGLGGMDERYLFAASGFWLISLMMVLQVIWKGRLAAKTAVILLLVIFFVWNLLESNRVAGHWQKAADISRRSILTIKRQYFPLDNTKAFVIVHLPTRIGRAWVFPVGFEDALWHMFRMNAYPYAVYKADSVEEALALPVGKASHEVLSFEGEQFELRRITKEIYLEEQLEKEKR